MLHSLTVYQLKSELLKRGLKVSGSKDELMIRLIEALTKEGIDVDKFLAEYEQSHADKEMLDSDKNSEKGAKPKTTTSEGEEGERGSNEIKPDDSVSNVSRGSRKSHSSVSHGSHKSHSSVSHGSRRSHSSRSGHKSVKDARVLEKAKLAGLKAKAAMLQRIQILQQEKLKLQQESDVLTIQAELAEAEAKVEELGKYESSFGQPDDRISNVERPIKNELGSVGTEHTTAVDNVKLALGTKSNLPINPTEVKGGVMDTLISYNLKSLMPRTEVQKFGGDCVEYHTFISAFDALISSKLVEDDEKLYYLQQYTFGKPRDIVGSCLYMDKAEGYKEARKLLEKRYGNPERIATAYLEKIMCLPVIKGDDVNALDEFAITLTNCKNAISRVPFAKYEMSNPKTIRNIIGKLPFAQQDGWRRKVDRILEEEDRSITFEDLVNFIECEARVMSNPLFGRHLFNKDTKPVNKSRGHERCNTLIHQNAGRNWSGQRQIKCWYCQEPHFLNDCFILREKPYDERVIFIRNKGLCFSCLRSGHQSKDCSQKKRCSICGSMHVTVLHTDIQTVENRDTQEQGAMQEFHIMENDTQDTVRNCSALAQRYKPSCDNVRMCVLPVRVKTGNGNSIETFAFIDNGSSASFITNELLEKIALNTSSRATFSVPVATLTGKDTIKCSLVSGLSVSSLTDTETILLPPLYTIDKIPISERDIVGKEDIEKWEHLRSIELPICHATPGLLIGINVPKAIEPFEVIHCPIDDGPFAVRTRLGWCIYGCTNMYEKEVRVNRISVSNLKLEKMLTHMYNAEFGDLNTNRKGLSEEDRQWLRIVENGCQRTEEGRYEIPLPVKQTVIKLPETKSYALRRLNSLASKMKRDHVYYIHYCSFMKEMIDKGYVEEVSHKNESNRKWYLPHFGVYHPHKPDKIRVVHDCAARVQSVCLNDVLLQGPDLNNNLTEVLIRFRLGSTAFIADIEGMFLQVKVPCKDRDLLRFVWWENGDLTAEPKIYRMTAHLFGAKSSPSCANYALQRVAQDIPGTKDAKETILNNFYVDDCAKAGVCETKMIKLAKEVKEMCKKGGFNLTKFISTSKKLEHELGGESDTSSREKCVLGLGWSLDEDKLYVKFNVKCVGNTKRELLSIVAGIYDPLGIASPSIMKGKLILQTLCKLKYSWDQKIENSLLEEFKSWIGDLQAKKTILVTRNICLFSESNVEYQIHNFSDASETAYGVVSYLRVSLEDNVVCTFLFGKGRVAPLKSVSIPRLELTAATLAININKLLLKALHLNVTKVFYWTDSTTVLRYIRNDSARYVTFVANRLSVIRDGSSKDQWKYVQSKDNPADDVTRGKQSDRWLCGPKFLYLSESKWPCDPTNVLDTGEVLEVRKTVNSLRVIDIDLVDTLIDYYSTWNKLKKAVGWILRVKDALLGKSNSSNLRLNCCDLQRSEIAILCHVHRKFYQSEMELLFNGKRIKKSSSIAKLSPILVDDILRVGGRLQMSSLSFEEKHPIILPSKCHVTTLIIRHYHEQIGHMGRSHVLSAIREKFWVINANSTVRRVLSDCVTCRKVQSLPSEQKMSNLPEHRLTYNEPPFTYVGIDCFGPFFTKRGRAQVKRYGVIFTCLVIRAVHIELAEDLSTSAFINCLRRFIARRGSVKIIRCDRGTNFVGAERELGLAISNWNQNDIHQCLLKKGIDWIFNPPHSSHFGGSWERQIRTIRKVLNFVINSQKLTDDSLYTFLCEAEMIVNSRPITTISNDINDLVALTPNHLLNLKGAADSLGDFSSQEQYARGRWKQIQHLSETFWNRWKREYMLTLQSRQKWTQEKENVSVGDLILVTDETLPRCHWPLGRITEVKYSQDKLVRSVKIHCKHKILERPVNKIVKILGQSEMQ